MCMRVPQNGATRGSCQFAERRTVCHLRLILYFCDTDNILYWQIREYGLPFGKRLEDILTNTEDLPKPATCYNRLV